MEWVDSYWWRSSLNISTGDSVIGYVAVDIYLGRCGREWGDCGRLPHCRSLLGKVQKSIVL